MLPAKQPSPVARKLYLHTLKMISLTRLDDTTIVLNALLIERIEETPDTVITLTTGRRVVVLESSDEVIKRAVNYLQGLRGESDEGEGVPNIAQLGRVTK